MNGIDLDLIYELHCIVGFDMVTDFYNELTDEEEKKEYIRVLKEYYDTKYWEKVENNHTG